jgi:uracil-DNA glycosylase family 4
MSEDAAGVGADADPDPDPDADLNPDADADRPADPAFPAPDSRLVHEPDCRRCPALADARTCISRGNGPRDADVLVVGEAPGAGDPDADRWRGGNHTGLAYTSRHSGRRVRRLLAAVGHADAFYTNAVRCFPPDGTGSNREPTPEERANCRPFLRRDVETVDPAVVVATGRHATASLLAFDDRTLDGFLERVLEPFRVESLGTAVVPILHPSYQAVWRSRLGYDEAGYREALREVLEEFV